VCDIYTVPFNDGRGGDAKPIRGASDPSVSEYYPDLSADDRWLAFTRSDSYMADGNEQNQLYYRDDGQVYVVPAAGGTATRLKANDPPGCSGDVSPGVYNAWPKWSPSVRTAGGKSYYFLLFSSARATPFQVGVAVPASQLYLTAIVEDDATHAIETYPAIYMWNQQNLVTQVGDAAPTTQAVLSNNVTPAWNEFQIPPVPPADIR
jgi:hypothetical protein